MAFDLQGALKAGYTTSEIADFLATQRGFDIGAARGAGYSDDQILAELTRPVKSATALESAADSALALGQGLISGAQMISDAFGADNAVSKKLESAGKTLTGLESDERRVEKAERAAKIRAAEQSGSTAEEIKAYLGAFAEAPVDTTLQAVGTIAPSVAGLFIPGVRESTIARGLATFGLGAVQGAGAVKGSIAQAVEDKLLEQGVAPEEAARAAAEAQAYTGQNAGQIALGAGLGAAAGRFGVEGLLTKGLGEQAAQRVAARTAGGVISEGVPEFAQGAQERVASNIALQNEGFDVPTFQGAAGQGALEAVAGGTLGGGLAAASPYLGSRQRANTPAPAPEPTDLARLTAEADAALNDLTRAVDPYVTANAVTSAGSLNDAITAAQAAVVVPDVVAPPLDLAAQRAMIDRNAELLAQAAKAGVQFERDMATEQAAAALPQAKEGQGAEFVDLTPMNPRQAQQRLTVLRDQIANEGGRALDLAVVPHPAQPGAFAIGRSPLPDLNLTPAPAPAVSPAAAQNRIESAALAGSEQQRRAEDAPRQDMISRAMANIEARGGVASPYEAELLRAANMGQPFNRIDPSIGRPASTDEKLTAATGIAVGQEAGLGFGARESTTQRVTPPFAYTPGAQGNKAERTEIPLVDAGQAFVNQMRATNTPAAQAFVRDYEAGRINDADVASALEAQRRGAATPDEVIAAAADLAPSGEAQGLQVERRGAPRVSQTLAEAVTLYGGRPYTEQELTAEGAAGRVGVSAAAAPAPAAQTGVQVEQGLAPRTDFRGRKTAIATANKALPPRPQRIQGQATSSITDEQLQALAADERVPAITRRGASIELMARQDEASSRLEAAAAQAPKADEATSRLEAAAAEGSKPRSGIIVTGARLSTKRLAPGAKDTVQDGVDAEGNPITHEITVVDPGRLGVTGRLLQQIARIFGKRLVVFESSTLGADGFVNDGDNDNIFINVNSDISPLAVFGHELTHLIKRDNPAAYQALEAVVRAQRTQRGEQAFSEEYNDDRADLLEELSSDLVGNRFQEASFWADVFAEIQAQNPEQAQTIIARLAAALVKAVNAVTKVIRQPGFNADLYVGDLNAVKAAVKQAVTEYAKSQRMSAMAMEAEVARQSTGVNLAKPEPVPLGVQPTAAPTPADKRAAATQRARTELGEPDSWRATPAVKREATEYERRTGMDPYTSAGQIEVPLEGSGTKFSVKRAYGEKEFAQGRANDPLTGLPLNKNGTVTLYFPTNNATAREMARTKRLVGATATANRIYLTNESSGPKVMNTPGNIDHPMDGANVLLQVDPRLLHLDQEFEGGRKDFFIPIAEGQAFASKMTKLFTLDAPRTRALSKDTKLTDLERRIDDAMTQYREADSATQRTLLNQAREILKREHNVGTLLGVNGKLEKTNLGGYGLNNYNGKDVMSMGLGLASAQKINEKNLSTCPKSAICEGLCLGETSGQNLLYGGEGQFKSGPRLAQYLKTEALVLNPEAFAIVLHSEIEKFQRAASKGDYQPTVRLNVTSDFRPQTFKAVIDAFPGVMFYDYTKLPSDTIAPNHHLTYSSTGASQIVGDQVVVNPESNWDKMVEDRLTKGMNVAMAFTSRTAMPKYILDERTGQRFQVWDGDNYDARFLDPKPGQPGNEFNQGMVIGLTNKDKTTKPEDAAVKHKGFFLDYDPERDGDTLVIRDQKALAQGGRKTIPLKIAASRKRSAAEAFEPGLISDLDTPAYKGREKLVEMPIDDFLRLAKAGEDEGKATDVKALRDGGKRFNSLPFLMAYGARDGVLKVDGHEGRHRARALKAAGYETMPVILRTDIRWSEQADPQRFDYLEQWPSRIVSEDGDASVPMPVSREQSMAPYSAGITASTKRQAPDTPAFNRWFGQGAVVDADGNPALVYHGGLENYGSGANTVTRADRYRPFWVTPDRAYAEQYGPARGGQLTALYTNIKNPADLDAMAEELLPIYNSDQAMLNLNPDAYWDEEVDGDFKDSAYLLVNSQKVMDLLAERGYDSVTTMEGAARTYGILDPAQIKRSDNAEPTASPDITKSTKRRAPTTPEFRKWFGDSVLVDDDGEPQLLYHGTADDITAFDLDSPNRKDTGWLGTGVYLTDNLDQAEIYAAQKRRTGTAGENVMPLYARLENPYRATPEDKARVRRGGRAAADAFTRDLQAQGYDGVIMQDGEAREIVVFDTAAVKSAYNERPTRRPELSMSTKRQQIRANADAIAAMDADTRDNTEMKDFPGGASGYNLYEARTLLKKPADKLKRVTERNSFALWQDYDYIANVDGEHFGVNKREDPDDWDNEDEDAQGFVYAFTRLDDPLNEQSAMTAEVDQLFAEMRAYLAKDSGATKSTRRQAPDTPEFRGWSKGLPVFADYDEGEGARGVYQLYHATPVDTNILKPGGSDVKISGPAIWLSPYPDYQAAAHNVGRNLTPRAGTNVIPVYARLERPLLIDDKTMLQWARDTFANGSEQFPQLVSAQTVSELTRDGEYDSVIFDGEKLGWGDKAREILVFKSDQVKSSIANVGTFGQRAPTADEVANLSLDEKQRRWQERNGGNTTGMTAEQGRIWQSRGDLRLSRKRRNILGQPAPLATWTAPTGTKFDDFVYTLQDKQIDTKRVVQAIKDAAGGIDDKWNAYLQEELFHGRTAKATKDFLLDELRPLMQDMQARGIDMAEFEEYLHNRHAEERNEQIARVNPAFPDGGSGIDTADARAYLAGLDPAKRRAYEALAARVDGITKGTRDVLKASGLETGDTIATWEGTYDNYVPLFREDLDFAHSDASGAGTGQGYQVRGAASKRATGSSREVVDILANIAMQRERAIVRAEKTRVAQAVYGLAVQYPNTDFWLAIDPAGQKDPARAEADLVRMGINPVDAKNIIEEPTQAYTDPRTGLVTYRVNPLLRSSDNVLAVRINGEEKYVIFNANDERSLRMARALKNMDADQLGRAMSLVAQGTRYFASINTQYNPIFGAVNFLRDVQGAVFNLSTTPIADRKAEVTGNIIPALRGIYASLRAERDGRTVASKWADLWEEFQKEGGQTGFRDMFSKSQERAEALQREINLIQEGKAKQFGRGIFNWLSDYNESMENAVRLAAYSAAKDKGMSNAQAASVAKNLTVNFNRKGQIGTQAGALYAFFNASVQGTARLAETMTGPAGRKIMAGGLLLGTAQAMLLAAAGFDEDEPPDYVKERNLIIPVGGGKYLQVPMPLGLNVIPNTSRNLTEYFLYGRRDPAKYLGNITGAFFEMFNPIGNAGWSVQTLTPTLVDPLAALSENRDYTGKPIAKQDSSNLDPTPGYTRAKETASWFSKQLAYYLNLASGGSKYKPGVISPTPDQIDYLIGQATGGLGREALKIEQTITSSATGEELPPYKIPLAGRFYGDTKAGASESSRFYVNLERINRHENEIKGRQKNREPLGDYLTVYPEARLYQQANSVERQIQDLRRKKRELLEKDAPRERVERIEEVIKLRMKAFNDQVARMRDGRRREPAEAAQ